MPLSIHIWSHLAEHRAVIPDHVVFRSMAQETVVLNVDTGRYHGLDTVGAHFWEALRASPTLTDARDALVAHYGQPEERIEADLAAFCDTLQRLGLIEVA